MICCAATVALVAGPTLAWRIAGAMRPLLLGTAVLAALLVPLDGHSHRADGARYHAASICGGRST